MMENWEELRRNCGPLVWATVYRILKNREQALDCYQEVFREAIERSAKAAVEDWPAFLRWLAVRRALDRLRRDRRIAAHISRDYDVARFARGREPCEDAEFRELVERVRLEMARLPSRQAEAFWLCCVEELTYVEAAKQMGTDANGIGVLIHRARSRLRTFLADLKPTYI
jgi:RNA polymerase sigma factor (sigma-70 family)